MVIGSPPCREARLAACSVDSVRIVHVLTYVSEDGSYGGPVAVAVSQCRALAENGHDVALVAGWDGRVALEVPGVDVRLHRVRRLPGLGFAGFFSTDLWRDVAALTKDCDVVHLHLARDLIQLPAAALAQRRSPTVLQTHGMVRPDKRLSARLLDGLMTRRVLRRARVLLPLTDAEGRDLALLAPGTASTRIRNGVAIPHVRAAWETPPLVLFLARLQARKRPSDFVEMAALVKADHPETRFLMVGADEGELDSMREQIARLNLVEDIAYAGAVAPSQVSDVLAQAQIYVLPSVDEPFPMSALEAMSHGLATVITTETGISDELSVRQTVSVVDPTPASLARAVMSLLDQDEWERSALAAREDAERNFSMAAVVAILETVYRETLS